MGNTVVIQFSGNFKQLIEQYKTNLDQMQAQANKLDIGSNIYKVIKGQLDQAASLIKKTDLTINTGVTKKSQYDTVLLDLQKIFNLTEQINSSFSKVNFDQINWNSSSFKEFQQQLSAIEREMDKLIQQRQSIEGMSVRGLLVSTGQQFSGRVSESVLNKGAIDYYNELGIQAEKAAQQIITAENKIREAQAQRENLQRSKQFLERSAAVNTVWMGAKNAEGNITKEGLIASASKFLNDSWAKNKTVDTAGVQQILAMFNLDQASIQAIIAAGEQAGNYLATTLATKVKAVKKPFMDNLGTKTKEGKSGLGTTTAIQANANTYDQYESKIQSLEAEIVRLTNKLNANKSKQSRISGRQGVMSQALSQTDYNSLNTRINDLTRQIAELKNSAIKNVQQGSGRVPRPPAEDPAINVGLSKKDAQDQMSASLMSMSQRWVSTYMIINKIRQGIRQAWSDIQELDKTMTNIAVVTDMSVSDLWGKINEYMSIAQQYGVTTQGVYEVSQIYYQQGLSTNEVMAATTETLKMARIAGMDYAKAADAMTVAIRSFKMEMSDAGHVTDVYSKVAAITASDSEELAIAMSKTASSAESVGSSFENTTAMLAVMIETTRESAQNLGSALKSIISRYGEMKVGLTVDSEGEEIDYNKVDTALKSIGISLKDAQGQFRDFDDVIFELSEKWDSLDKNTQRYIATIMAGNRQQSRFIALVDNWERLDEVATSAQDSEDAGLIQYAKTLDSLESKINNVKTSFQEFYMDMINGDFFKGILDVISDVIQGFSKLSGFFSIQTITNFILGIKTIFNLLTSSSVSAFATMFANYKNFQQRKTTESKRGDVERSNHEVSTDAQAQQKKINNHRKYILQKNNDARRFHLAPGQTLRPGSQPPSVPAVSAKEFYTTQAAQMGGSALSIYGANLIGKGGSDNYKYGTVLGVTGNILSSAATGYMMGGRTGAIITALLSVITQLKDIFSLFDKNLEREQNLQKAQEAANEANIKRAEAKDEYTTLKGLIDKINTLDETKYDSDENYQNWIAANNQLVEAYPQFIGYIDEAGNTIADLTNASDILSASFIKTAQANRDYYIAKVNEIEQAIKGNYYSYTESQYSINTDSTGKVYQTPRVDVGYKFLKDFSENELVTQTNSSAFQSGIFIPGTEIGLGTSSEGFSTRQGTISPSSFFKGLSKYGLTAQDYLEYANNQWEFIFNKSNPKASTKTARFTTEQIEALQAAHSIANPSTTNGWDSISYFDKEAGTYKYTTAAQNILTEEKKLQELLGTKQAAIQSGLSLASYSTNADDELVSMPGFLNLVSRSAEALYTSEGTWTEASYKDLAAISTQEYERIVTPFIDLYNSLSSSQDQATFSNLYKQMSSITLSELIEQLKNFGIEKGDKNPYQSLYTAYVAEWQEQNYSAQLRLFNVIWGEQSQLDSYGAWLSKNPQHSQKDQNAKKELYQKYLKEQIITFTANSQQELYGILFNEQGDLKISLDEATQLTSFYTKQQDIVNTSNSVLAKQAAQKRLNFLATLYADLSNIDFTKENWQRDFDQKLDNKFGDIDYTKWSAEDAINLQNLLVSEDAGTDAWTTEMDTLFAKYGHTINWASDELSKILYTNLNTKITTAADKVKTALEDMKDLSDKQSSGFTWKESETLLKKFGENTTWEDIFTINEKGLIVLKNFDKSLETLYQKRVEELNKATQDLTKIVDPDEGIGGNLFSELKNSLAAYSKGGITDDEKKSWITQLQTDYEIDATTADNLISWMTSTTNPTTDSFLAYVETLIGSNEKLAEYFETQKHILQAETDFNSYFDKHYGAGNARKSLTNNPTLKNIKDYAISANLIEEREGINDEGETYKYYNWETYFSGLTGIAIDSLGDVEITDADTFVRSMVGKNAGEQLTAVEQEWINSLNSTITSGGESAISTVKSLGADAARGKADWASAYNGAVKETKSMFAITDDQTTHLFDTEEQAQTYKEKNQLTDADIQEINQDILYTNEELNEIINSELEQLYKNSIKSKEQLKDIFSSAKYGKKYEELNHDQQKQIDDQVTAAVDSYGDAVISDTATYNELISKYIKGTITSTERTELETLSSTIEGASKNITSSLGEEGAETVQAYHAAVLEAIKTNATEEDIKSAIEDELSVAMKTRKAGSVEKYDLTEAQQALEASAGSYTTNILDDWYTAWVMAEPELGRAEKLSATEFYNLFTYNEKLQSWVYDTTKAVDEETSEILETLDEKLANIENARAALQIESDSTAIQDALVSALGEIETVTLESLADMYEQIHGTGTFAQSGLLPIFQKALEEAESGNTNLLIEHLQVLANSAYTMGYDVDFSELEAALEDAQISLIDRLVGFLEAGIEGTLSATEHADLKDRYGLSEGIQTAQGIQLTRADQQKMFGTIYGQARVSGNLQGIEDTLLDILPDGIVFENLSEAIDEAEKAAGGLKNRTEDTASAAWDYYDALVAAQKALMLNEDAYDFTFMEQEPTDGLTANFDNFKDQIDSVTDAFKAFKSKETIDYKDFYNMMDFINEQGQWESFTEKVNKAGLDYEQFVNSVVSNTDEWGKVDIGSVAAELGISVDAAMTAMSESMTESLIQTAKEQVKYLSGLEAMLEAMAALEGLNTEYDISFGITYKDGDKVKSFEGIQDVIDYYNKLPDNAAKKEFIIEITEKYNTSGDIAQQNAGQLLKIFGADFEITDTEWNTVESFEKAWDAAEPEMRQELQKTLGQITTEQAQWIAENATSADGTIDFSKIWEALLNPEHIGSSYGAALQQAFASLGTGEITIDNQKIKINMSSLDGNDFEVNIPGGVITDEILNTIDTYLKKHGVQIDRTQSYTLDGNNNVKFQVIGFNENLQTALQQGIWNYDENGIGTQTINIGDGQTLNLIYKPGATSLTAQLPDGTSKEQLQAQIANAYQVAFDSVTIEDVLDESGKATGEVTISVDFSTQTDALALIQESVQTIADAVTKGVVFTIDNEAALSAIGEIEQAIQNLPDSHLLTVNVKQNNLGATLGGAVGSFVGGMLDGMFSGNSEATGNVNNLHGAALVEGNASNKLLAGAQLANKTLVGELGPELAVYNGEYHMLGANGAEFVKLPDDAIVFNHLQTAGILNGQMNVRGQALVNGNVSGPALASGASAALQAVRRAKSVWQSLINDLSAADLIGAAGGGGGGENSVKAVTEELVKWYNLSRQIEKLEQDINNILAERENIVDGGEYLRSLREQQKLLAQQAATQQTLLAYQEEQLERQKQHILNNKIWSQFLTFDDSGNLQYIVGNESNGGQGQLNVLEQLNKMSGEEQLDYIKNTLGYSYTDQDGNELDGEDLITKFFEELQGQIDSYDALFDTVNSTEEKLQEIQSTINEIDQEIEQNQMDLEQAIYDILVDAWEKQIEQMEEQMELVREANEAYIENLNKALSDERDMYSQNESIADRESLQNRLALLRRSGGSASEIYDLEQQLDDMLKDEYFNKQEEMIEHIEEANEEQIRKLEEQIKLEEEALEYQKENGVLWTQVYEIMRGTEESILAFMQGNSPEFFSQSTLQQKKMLIDWAKQIGIYTEDQQYKNYQKEAEDTRWNNGSWRASTSEGGVGRELAAVFDGLSADQKGALQSLFTSTYANKMLETDDKNAASAAAIAALQAQLRNIQSQQASAAAAASSGSGSEDSNSNNQPPQQEKRYVYMRGTYKEDIPDGKGGFTFKKGEAARVGINTNSTDKDFIRQKIRNAAHGRKVEITNNTLYGFSEGGLVDYTGPALVHGTPSKPEAFLNAKQTAMISEAVKAVGDGGALNGIKATLAALNSTIKGIVNNDNSLTSSFTVAPGAVTIQVAQLNDSYDVEELSKDVMNRMVAIASRTTNRGVNRR